MIRLNFLKLIELVVDELEKLFVEIFFSFLPEELLNFHKSIEA